MFYPTNARRGQTLRAKPRGARLFRHDRSLSLIQPQNDLLEKLLNTLRRRDALVIKLLYPLILRERVLEAEALDTLRCPSRTRYLRELLETLM